MLFFWFPEMNWQTALVAATPIVIITCLAVWFMSRYDS